MTRFAHHVHLGMLQEKMNIDPSSVYHAQLEPNLTNGILNAYCAPMDTTLAQLETACVDQFTALAPIARLQRRRVIVSCAAQMSL